jgi:hypothetical protein
MNSTVPQPSSVQKKHISKLAITSFIFGIPGVLLLLSGIIFGNLQPSSTISPIYVTPFILSSIIAFICGIIALNTIEKSKNLKGNGWPRAGLVEALVIIVPGLFILFFVIAIYLHLYVT